MAKITSVITSLFSSPCDSLLISPYIVSICDKTYMSERIPPRVLQAPVPQQSKTV